MTEKGQNELAEVLQDGAAALKEIRRGVATACAELRDLYRGMPTGNIENSRLKQYVHQALGGNNTEDPANIPFTSTD